ncbi:MAG: NAD(+) synthase [Candidatus Saganbacteria bacterium]|nr:NAD(+) synthase [Candidatus Saganbacteria bacterium]
MLTRISSMRRQLIKRLEIVPADVRKTLVNNTREKIKGVGPGRVVVGLSGGVDSTLAATIARQALGSSNVIGLNFPSLPVEGDELVRPDGMNEAEFEKREFDFACAKLAATSLGIDLVVRSIYDDIYHSADRIEDGTFTGRLRNAWFWRYAYREKAWVLGTLNRTERLLGFTVHGGYNVYAINPNGMLFKTQLWQLARSIDEIPDQIKNRAASTGLLKPGEHDIPLSSSFGCDYADVDPLLYLLFEMGGYHRYLSRGYFPALGRYGFSQEFVKAVIDRYEGSRFKNRVPINLSFKTIPEDADT